MLTEKDYCDYNTCVALKEIGYNQSSIAFYPCQDIIVDCIDSNGELYEVEYNKGNLVLYSSLNNKNYDINNVQAPLLYEAHKWLREEKGIFSDIGLFNDGAFYYCIRQKKNNYWVEIYRSFFHDDLFDDYGKFESYEEALSEGIKKAIKILKENGTV